MYFCYSSKIVLFLVKIGYFCHICVFSFKKRKNMKQEEMGITFLNNIKFVWLKICYLSVEIRGIPLKNKTKKLWPGLVGKPRIFSKNIF